MHCKDCAYDTKGGKLFSEPVVYLAAEEALHLAFLGCHDKILLT